MEGVDVNRAVNRDVNRAVKIVLIGGGHTHVLALRRWFQQGLLRTASLVDVVLVSEAIETAYSGMLTGYLAGLYAREHVFINLANLAQRYGFALRAQGVVGIDRTRCEVILAGGERLTYDVLSIDCGATADLSRIPGASEYAVPIKPVHKLQETLTAKRLHGQRPTVVMIGGGPAGVEVICALSQRWRREGRAVTAHLFTAGHRLVPEWTAAASRLAAHLLRRHSINVHCGTRVERIEATQHGYNVVAQGESEGDTGREPQTVAADLILVATEPRAAAWVAQTDLRLTEDGFLCVDSTLRTSDPLIFACGDVAQNPRDPWPRAGVFAVRAAPVLADNLMGVAMGREEMRHFRPQRRFLALLVDGFGGAWLVRGSLALGSHRTLWWLKDWIDRRFMRKFQT